MHPLRIILASPSHQPRFLTFLGRYLCCREMMWSGWCWRVVAECVEFLILFFVIYCKQGCIIIFDSSYGKKV